MELRTPDLNYTTITLAAGSAPDEKHSPKPVVGECGQGLRMSPRNAEELKRGIVR
jgi:hypothetical protein